MIINASLFNIKKYIVMFIDEEVCGWNNIDGFILFLCILCLYYLRVEYNMITYSLLTLLSQPLT